MQHQNCVVVSMFFLKVIKFSKYFSLKVILFLIFIFLKIIFHFKYIILGVLNASLKKSYHIQMFQHSCYENINYSYFHNMHYVLMVPSIVLLLIIRFFFYLSSISSIAYITTNLFLLNSTFCCH